MKKKTQLNMAWTDLSWEVQIRNHENGGCRLDRDGRGPVRRTLLSATRDSQSGGQECLPYASRLRSRFEPLSLPPDLHRRLWAKSSRGRSGGFTIIELLVVIGIIGILAAILLPTLSVVKTRAKVANARTEMRGLAAAISAYEGDYNRYPASQPAEQAASTAVPPSDFTFGNYDAALPLGAGGDPPVVGGNANNSNVVVLLLSLDVGVNANNVRNPRKVKYWNAKMVSSVMGGVSTTDYIARDPWGNPYIITMDMNDDNKCMDFFYSAPAVSETPANTLIGYYGLTRRANTAPFELNGPVMIWSPGPDKMYDIKARANAGYNKDNVLSWSN